MKLYHPLTVDLYNLWPLPVVSAQQGNVGRGVLVTLTADGESVELSENEDIKIYAKKPDGTNIYSVCTIENNQIKAVFTNQMLAVPGMLKVELEITGGEMDRITTPIFLVEVRPSNIDGAIESSNEFSAIKELVLQAQKDAERAEEAAENADKAAAGAKEAETAARTAADAAMGAAQRAAESAGNAEESRQAAAESAASAQDYSKESESFAHGNTGVRPGEDTDNSKYYSEQSQAGADRAAAEADRASVYAEALAPKFVLQDNRLYMSDNDKISFIVKDNRLYFKLVA